MSSTNDDSVLLTNLSVWTEAEESRKSPMFENMNVIKDETGQHMVEILCSGSSSAISKPIRSIHQYINSLIEKISVGLVVCDDAYPNPSKSAAQPSGGNSASTSTTSKDLHFRDLRLLYTPLNPNETHTILVRSHCVLVSLDPFQAVIMADRIIVVLPTNSDANENMGQILRMFENSLRGWHRHNSNTKQTLNDSGRSNVLTEGESEGGDGDHIPNSHIYDMRNIIPFEMQVYEMVFTTVGALHRHEYGVMYAESSQILSSLFPRSAVNIPYALQEKMRSLKDHVSRMINNLGAYKRALSLLLEDEYVLSFMNLSIFRDDPQLYRAPLTPDVLSTHERIEELLESHLLDVESLEAKLSYLLKTLQNAEASVSLKLDIAQDKIMLANTRLSVAVVMISLAAYFTGVFGMSLDQTITIQNKFGGFEVVFVLSFCIIIIGIPLVLYYLERTGALPRIVRFRPFSRKYKKSEDVMGISSMMS